MLDLAIISEREDMGSGDISLDLGIEWLAYEDWYEQYDPSFNYFGDAIERHWKLVLDGEGAQKFYSYGFNRVSEFKVQPNYDGGGITVYYAQKVVPGVLGDKEFHNCVEPQPYLGEIPCPSGEKYMDHQLAAIHELDRRLTGALLADDMGLGKTITALGLINMRKYRKILVVCPAGLRGMWNEHAERWIVDTLQTHVINVSDLDEYMSSEDGLYIMSYETIRLNDDKAEEVRRTHWDMVILDESERIKNPKSSTALQIVGGIDDDGNEYEAINADYKLLVSGTPIPNRMQEIWTSFHYLFPDIFIRDLAKDFVKKFGGQRRKYGNHLEALRKWFECASIRRRKSVVMENMPPKSRKTEMLTVSAQALSRLHEIEDQAIAHSFASDGLGLFRVGFAQWARVWSETAKAKALPNAEYLWKFLDKHPDEKVVFFRHHKITRDGLMMALRTRGIQFTNFDGEMNTDAKDEAVRLFQLKDSPHRVIIVSITSGGRGITLTRARHCMFGEINPVPSNLLQCEDRLHRIGQTRPVQATYLYTYGSIEAHMGSIVQMKLPVIEAVVEGKRIEKDIVEVKTDLREIIQEIGDTGISGAERFWRIKQILLHQRHASGENQGQRMYGSSYLEFEYAIGKMRDSKTNEPFKIVRPSRERV